MRAGFQVTTEHGTLDVTVTLAEWLRLGKREGRPVAEVAANPSIETMIELMHWAAIRQELTDLDLEAFAATIIDIERVSMEDPKVTPKVRGNGSKSGSKSTPARIGQTPPQTTS